MSPPLQAMERGIEGSFLDAEQRGRGFFDMQRNPESVMGACGERLQDQQLERGLGFSRRSMRLTE